MKVDLTGRFQDLKQLLDAPAQQTKVAGNFATLLGQLVDNTVFLDPKAEKGISEASLKRDILENSRASLRSPTPELLPPTFVPLQSPEIHPPTVNTPDLGVKSPTIISAKRTTVSDPYKSLSESQRRVEIQKLVSEAGSRHGVDPALSLAVVSVESAFNPNAISSDGFKSKGLMQLLDSTAQTQIDRTDSHTGEYKPFDPKTNINLGVGYLRHLHSVFNEATELSNDLSTIPAANSSSLEKLAVAAFNAGEGRVATAQMRAKAAGLNPTEYQAIERYLPESTQQYVRKVLSMRDQFEGNFIG